MRRPVVVATVAAAFVAPLTFTVGFLEDSPSSPLELLDLVLVVLGGALFLGSGALRTAAWRRVLGEQRSLLMGTALIVLGGLAIPLTSLAGVVMGADDRSMLHAATAMLTTGVTMTLIIRALTTRGDKSAHALPVLVGSAVAAIALFTGVLVVHAWAPQLLHSESLPPPVVRGGLLAVAWLYVGLEAALRSEQRPWAGKVAPLLGCMGVAEVLRVVAVYRPDGIWELAASALVATLAAIAAHRALVDLESGATERGDGAGAPTNRGRSRTVHLGGTAPLEHLLLRGDRVDSVDFDVAAVVAEVLEDHRSTGIEVELDIAPAHAHGRPADLATALLILLANARDHGGGRAVVRTVERPGRVEIEVADFGPGLVDGQVATLFERGPGLGLHVSRTLMRQQGGDLQLRGHHGGAAFAVVLDAARAPTPATGAEARWLDGRWPVSPCAG
jgi:signal transduction histidine kinase